MRVVVTVQVEGSSVLDVVIVLKGYAAVYTTREQHQVLTRYIRPGDVIGFEALAAEAVVRYAT
jgi:hypothetical protein